MTEIAVSRRGSSNAVGSGKRCDLEGYDLLICNGMGKVRYDKERAKSLFSRQPNYELLTLQIRRMKTPTEACPLVLLACGKASMDQIPDGYRSYDRALGQTLHEAKRL